MRNMTPKPKHHRWREMAALLVLMLSLLLLATPFPQMPSGDNWPHIRAVIAHERALRLAHVSMTAADIERLPLPAYWQHVVCLFAIHAERHHAKRIDREKLALLPACFARSLENLYRAELAR